MGLKDSFRSKRILFDELWKQVEGIPEGVKKQISADLSDRTKRKLEKLSPKDVEEAVNKTLAEVDKGSIETVDPLIRRFI